MGLDNKSSDVFEVRGKLEYPGNTLSQSTEQQSQPTISIHCGIKPGHIGGNYSLNLIFLLTGIQEMKNLGIEIDMETIDTNMVYFKVNNNKVSANDLVKSMFTVSDTDPMEKQVAVKMLTLGKNRIRLVLHHQVTEADIQNTLQKMRIILTS